jgi:hypothetical protein
MFCLNNIIRNTLLVNTILICMMFYLNKHIYDIMIILIKSFLWIKLNMNLPKFLTDSMKFCWDWRKHFVKTAYKILVTSCCLLLQQSIYWIGCHESRMHERE